MKHIIWDFNGTLLGDAQLSVDVDNAVFDRLGLPRITLDTYRRHMTMPVCDFYAALGIDLVAYPYETISRLWLDLFNAGAVGAGLVPGALEAVRHFDRIGYTQSVLSASYAPSLRAQCDALGLTPYMRAIDGRADESGGKKTDIARKHMARLGLTGDDTILVGDMATDAQLAQKLGARCVLVSWGHNDLPRLEASGCLVVHSFDQLKEILFSLHSGSLLGA